MKTPIDVGGFVRRNWGWLLVGLASLALLAGGTTVALSYFDQKSFVKMMDGILKQIGVANADARLAMIAHAGVESALGTKSTSNPMKTFNFWNITAGSQWKGPTSAGTDKEYGKTITQAWRVYANPMAAAKDYLSFLSRTTRIASIAKEDGSRGPATASYADALQKLMGGDVQGFVYTLRDAGYYTAPAADYYAMIQGQMGKARGLLVS